jgi:hypothetical protein
MQSEEKLSTVILRIAQNMFLNPNHPPSSEAAHAALLLAHAGWNRSLGHPLGGYDRVLAAFQKERPSFWDELKSRSAEALIIAAEMEKRRLWPADQRIILICGMREGNVHVEWCLEPDFESSKKRLEQAVRNPPPWLREVDP